MHLHHSLDDIHEIQVMKDCLPMSQFASHGQIAQGLTLDDKKMEE